MRLRDLLKFDNIVVQCHDNPDADAIASGFGVYTYLKDNGKNVSFIYSGKYKIEKSNLLLMISEFDIPLEYREEIEKPDLLVTVDCQYGEGNVTRFEAEEVAVIDHHQVSGVLPRLNEVQSNLGACATVVRELLFKENIDINDNQNLATVLYYGLLKDTNNFAEISHPKDKDLRDDAQFNQSDIARLKNMNISLRELEIAGATLLNYKYSEKYKYVIAQAEPCDPNILGMISDMILEVDSVDTCLVYAILPFGIKLSVRSCTKEVKASEFVEYITLGIGSGGGHLQKAGGFIKSEFLEKIINIDSEDVSSFLTRILDRYFSETKVIYAKNYVVDISDMKLYKKKRIPLGYVKATDISPVKKNVVIRTLEGDLEVELNEDIYIVIGALGEIYPNTREKFESGNELLNTEYEFNGEYAPVVKDILEGKNIPIIPYAKSCLSKGGVPIYVKQINEYVKIFTEWDKDSYMLGKPGDFLAVRQDDMHDIYIIRQDVFGMTYEKL